MDQETPLPEEKSPEPNVCAGCSHPVIEPGYPTPLCKDCRTRFIRFPIPSGIKIFGAILGLILLYAMWGLPKILTTGIHFQRGKEAIKKQNYFTGQRELKTVIKRAPSFLEAKEYLAIASFYNYDLETFANLVQDLQGKKIEDGDVYEELSLVINKGSNYFPSDSIMAVFEQYHSWDSIPETEYEKYISKYPDELFPAIRYASLLYDNEKYPLSDSLLNTILKEDPTYISALNMKTGLKREFKQLDSAHFYCDKILLLNKESTFGMSSKARTFLKQKNNAEGLEWALKSIDKDPGDPYSLATLALAYHFNNKTKERDELLKTSKNDSLAATYMQYTIDVMEGKEKFID